MNTIRLGLGEVVIQTGTSNGKPCIVKGMYQAGKTVVVA